MRFFITALIFPLNAFLVHAFVEPVTIRGRHFVKAYSGEPFFIKGVDYQPGGSSGVSHEKDPLSDVEACTRDILLFQDLGINSIRVYSVNPDLNHDKCMTLLAIAGIYLVLDVNSPLENQHLNRYEPWKTYNGFYLEHVFKVIQEFSSYNNTLAFFAGNEIVNDRASAQALVRDMKSFMAKYAPRQIPVGYSAADDLSFRTSLPNFLGCDNDNGQDTSIDFYGVNSYQWCGDQTIQSSGYDILVRDYEDFNRPVFFSEYGCNEVTPRQFQEVEAIYSQEMTGVFSGGLVYEFHQEDNKYGLIEYDSNGNVQLLEDYKKLKEAFENLEVYYDKNLFDKKRKSGKKGNFIQIESNPSKACEGHYDNIITAESVPELGEISSMINTGISGHKGRFVALDESDLTTNFEIKDIDGQPYAQGESIKIITHPKNKQNYKHESSSTKSGNPSNRLLRFFYKNEASNDIKKVLFEWDWIILLSLYYFLV